ncbi:transcription factor S [Nanobdella aerobiophila]|uniref:Transcription factor S n=1 Tax=Nanobdella aerobiophila TaxID=2586965 RepID=A0A915T001_9ARCH|nr:transcription factor S [Nanobdella aerobiophila]BBL45574.1 transcription factor S [Nanobdella aerobiophila]
MKFCPKCGTLMKQEDKYFICPKCKHKEKKGGEKTVFTEKINKSSEITVLEHDYKLLPIDNEIVCPECNKSGAYFWSIQTRAGDEGETKFYKCINCGYTWRVYD